MKEYSSVKTTIYIDIDYDLCKKEIRFILEKKISQDNYKLKLDLILFLYLLAFISGF
jgi:hypothetical protein